MDNQNFVPNSFSISSAHSVPAPSTQSSPQPATPPAQPPLTPPQFNPTAAKQSSRPSTGLIIALILTSLLAATFIGLFVWMFVQWDDIKTDVGGKINAAVATAVEQNTAKLETKFAEKEKYPYTHFAGPSDYGELSFEYPKTWHVYEASAAGNKDDYRAYLNPGKVPTIDQDHPYALRVTILNQLSETVIADYAKAVQDGELKLTVQPVNGENANIYTGTLDDGHVGILAVFRIRDKTVVLRTDSEKVFGGEFYKLLKTIKYNK